ncbi:MAG: response regulator [Pseudomonadota bacterium]
MHRVLIAEDDAILSKRLVRTLEKHGDRLTVVTAADGQEAIDILGSGPVALLITDIQMPRVDGLQLLAHINAHHPLLPCFVMTAYGSLEMQARMPADLLRFYHKPFDLEEMAADVLTVLSDPEFIGDRAGISIYSFLQLIQLEQVSCRLDVDADAGLSGHLLFRDGNLLDAVCGDKLTGDDAARALIQRRKARFGIRFFPKDDASHRVTLPLETFIGQSLA